MAERSSDVTAIDKFDSVSRDAESDIAKYTSDGMDDDRDNMGMSADNVSDDSSDEKEQIKAQIEETRANLGETIDAIQDRLSFANISEQVSEQVTNVIETAKDSAYDATIGKVVNFMKDTGNDISESSVGSMVRNNPLPLLLIGLGAGLLAYQGFGKQKRRDKSLSQYRYAKNPSYVGERGQRKSESSLVQTAQDGLGSVKDGVSNAAGTAYDAVTNVASSTYSGAGDLAKGAYEKAGDLGTTVQETYTQYLEEKPWAIGAVALVAGAAIGLAIPSSRYEGELMGEARYNLLNKAQETATGLVDKAKQVATEAGNTIVDEVKTQAKTLDSKV